MVLICICLPDYAIWFKNTAICVHVNVHPTLSVRNKVSDSVVEEQMIQHNPTSFFSNV